MLLFELFDSNGDMMQKLRQEALNFITPLIGQDIPFVTVQQVTDALKNDQFGITINRGLVMQILNPDEVKAVSKIEGDRIYMNEPDTTREVGPDEAEKDQDHVNDMAQKQASKSVQQ